MKIATRLALLLLVAFPTGAFAQKSAPGKPFYGPSWFVEEIWSAKKRPEKVTEISISADHEPQKVKDEVRLKFWADFPVESGHTYELRVQYRLFTTLKEPQALLGTPEYKLGIGYTVATAKADATWNGIEGTLTVHLADLAKMTNLPGFNSLDDCFRIAAEPQLYDATTGEYVTKPMHGGLLLMLRIRKGMLFEIEPASEWLAQLSWGDKRHQDDAVRLLANLKGYALNEVQFEYSFENMLGKIKDDDAALAKFVAAIPVGWLHIKSPLFARVQEYADTGSPVLKAAAEKRLKDGTKP